MPEDPNCAKEFPALIRFQRPTLPDLRDVDEYWGPARAANWFSNTGPVLSQFATALEGYLGGQVHAVPVNNATSGLMVALRALCTPGKEATIVMPSYTFAATATATMWAGFTPRFVDVDPSSWHADPVEVEMAVERDNPAALLLCSTYGVAPPRSTVERWAATAREAGIPLVVDAAAGFGSRDENGLLSQYGDAQVFSFHATKPFAIGEGGLVTTRNPDTAATLRRLANFGFDEDRVLRGPVGMNAKMDELHAATGLAVLADFEDVLSRRRHYALTLAEAFAASGLRPQAGMASAAHQFLPLMCIDGAQRNGLLALAKKRNIELRAYFSEPLHTMPSFSTYRHESNTLNVTETLASRIACLPLYSEMSGEVLNRLLDLASEVRGT